MHTHPYLHTYTYTCNLWQPVLSSSTEFQFQSSGHDAWVEVLSPAKPSCCPLHPTPQTQKRTSRWADARPVCWFSENPGTQWTLHICPFCLNDGTTEGAPMCTFVSLLPLMVGPGGWATVTGNTRADQIQRRTCGRDKCENITDWKSKHPAQILEASVVHGRSGGRASFLSCTNLSLGAGTASPSGTLMWMSFFFLRPFLRFLPLWELGSQLSSH